MIQPSSEHCLAFHKSLLKITEKKKKNHTLASTNDFRLPQKIIFTFEDHAPVYQNFYNIFSRFSLREALREASSHDKAQPIGFLKSQRNIFLPAVKFYTVSPTVSSVKSKLLSATTVWGTDPLALL